MTAHCEIGSEFWDIPVQKGLSGVFPASIEWFVSGRSAFSAIIAEVQRTREVHTAALPSWCCESMILPLDEAGIDISFYTVTYENGLFKQDISPVLNCDLILVMGYFGMSDPPEVPGAYRGVVVEDVTHTLLSTGCCERADYRYGSLRKWCGVWTGGFAWSSNQTTLGFGGEQCDSRYIELRRRAMEEKAAYIERGEGDKGYLATFAEAEKWLDAHAGPMHATSRDETLALHLNAVDLRKARRSNANVLLQNMTETDCVIPVFSSFRDNDCPLFVPILVKERDSLRQFLIKNDVYCPVHWPLSCMQKLDRRTRIFYERGLSLVCDQRYGTNDMLRIVELIQRWQKTS